MSSRSDRFWRKVKRGSSDECWPWTGSVSSWGYGDAYYLGRRTNASRIAYSLANNVIPDGMVVCHSCDNRLCCNPSHLWVGTQGDNVRDCNEKKRGRGQFSQGEHPRHAAKITPATVLEIRRLHFIDGVSQSEIGRRIGLHSSTVSRAVRGESWSHVE